MFEQSGIRGVIINGRTLEVFRKKVFCLQKAVKKASDRGGRQLNALLSKLETGPRYRFNIISISVSYSFVSFLRGFAGVTHGFPAPRKAVTTHVKQYDILHAPLGQDDE